MMILYRVTSPNNGKKMKKKMNNIYFYVLSLMPPPLSSVTVVLLVCVCGLYIVEVQKRHSLLFDMENDEKFPVRYSLSQNMKEEICFVSTCKIIGYVTLETFCFILEFMMFWKPYK